jgi:hypothetical protein
MSRVIQGIREKQVAHSGDEPSSSLTVIIDRASVPPGVLMPRENYRNTPYLSRRGFQVLICQKAEFENGLWGLEPDGVKTDAWTMLEEFLNHIDDLPGLDSSVLTFLNKWGLWDRSFFAINSEQLADNLKAHAI